MEHQRQIADLWPPQLIRLAALFGAALLMGAFLSLLRTSGSQDASIDFAVFWAAAHTAITGNPVGVFDHVAMQELTKAGSDVWFPFAYPPAFVAFLAPFGLLPFPLAWLAFVAVSIGVLFWAAGRIVPFRSLEWRVLAFPPAFLPALVVGQTSVLWFAVLIAALSAMFRGQNVLAGVLIGCLTIKPQLGILIPLALLIGGQWRVFAAAAVTAVLLIVLPTIWVGTEYWAALWTTMTTHAAKTLATAASLDRMVSILAFGSAFGLGTTLALLLNYALAAFAIVLLALAWRPTLTSDELRAATLICGVMLASPYLWYYDAAGLAPLAYFLARSGHFGKKAVEHWTLIMFWVGAGPLVMTQLFAPDLLPVRLIMAPVLILALGGTAIAVARQRRARLHPQTSDI